MFKRSFYKSTSSRFCAIRDPYIARVGNRAVLRYRNPCEVDSNLNPQLYTIEMMRLNPSSAISLNPTVLNPSESAINDFASMVANDKTLDND